VVRKVVSTDGPRGPLVSVEDAVARADARLAVLHPALNRAWRQSRAALFTAAQAADRYLEVRWA